MRVISSVTMVGALATALILAAWQPAVAGRVCNELDLRSPCIRSNDIRANIALGGSTGDGRLRLRNEDGVNAVELRASDGNVNNLFSNEADQSNGLVKAWAQINADGTIVACWRCNTDPNETRRLSTRSYEVDFAPLATDMTDRPRLAAIDLGGFIVFVDRAGDASPVFVSTRNSDDVFSDQTFVLIIL